MGFWVFLYVIAVGAVECGELGEDATIFFACALYRRRVEGAAVHEDGIDAQFVEADVFSQIGPGWP